MKKLFLLFAAAMLTVSASAQKTTITSNKGGDNWYVGGNIGLSTPVAKFPYGTDAEGAGRLKGFAPKLGVRVGRNFTTVFGLALDADIYALSSEKSMMKQKTFIDAINVDLLGTFNLNNLFAGYKGEPRPFEVIALIGGGYSHSYGCSSSGLNAKGGVDLAINMGANKAWQLYFEPAVVLGQPTPSWRNPFRKLNGKWNAIAQLSVGVNYKFGNSNGSHNYKFEQLRDQAEIDGLNARINDLRAANDAKAKQIDADAKTIQQLKNDLAAAKNVKPVQNIVKQVVNNNVLQPTIIFGQGKSTVDAAQMASVAMVAKYMKNHPDARLLIKGYASPEGNPELNQKLSEKRARSVMDVLVKRYGVSANRLEVKGMGATDELFDEVDFNRVATFTDLTK
jgi:outer membrane protein OmpA-like peptidoglycan-associated protein